MSSKKKPARLILATGQEFEGESFGFDGFAEGEVVFTTGMTGFELSLTDPSFAGQILVFTFPLVGNVGMPSLERDENGLLANFESEKIQVRGVVCSNLSRDFSHHKAENSLNSWLRESGIPLISGVDTRALTQVLRTHGTCLGQIVPRGEAPRARIADPNETNLVAAVSVDQVRILKPKKPIGKRVVAVDTGIKNNILRSFSKRGVEVAQVPWDFDLTKADFPFDGLFLSNGPGDPKVVSEVVGKNILWAYKKGLPIFGICLGNQVLSLAMGGDTYKLPFGHRGVNQPCQDLRTKKCYITSQNHGYAVDDKKLPKNFEVWFRNLNDGSVEGVRHKTKPVFSVQFHPEAFPGPEDTAYLFDDFIKTL